MICGGDDYDKVIWHEAAGCHGLVGTISLWPWAVHAQQSPVPLIGFLSGRSLADSVELVNAFHRGLAETSHAEGHKCWHRMSLGQWSVRSACRAGGRTG